MSLDMYGHIDIVFESLPDGGVVLYQNQEGYYDYNNGGVWVEPDVTPAPIASVNIQGADGKTMELMAGMGGTTNPRDVRVVHFNDGTMVYPADEGRNADELGFSDGLAMRRWRVMTSDPRPWRNYCRAVVHRMPSEDS